MRRPWTGSHACRRAVGAATATAVFAALLLTGCAAPKVLSPYQAQAVALNRQGLDSFAAGDYVRAQQAFEAALRLERSVENEEGIALNLLNLAQCQQRLGRPERAAAMLDDVLETTTLRYAPQRRAEAAMQHALLSLQGGDLAAAERWQRDGAAICGDCALAGKLRSLAARLALQRGDGQQALRAAADALAKSGDDKVEQANALRLQGAAQLALGQPAEATLLQALALDKDGGLADKVVQDLQLLGRAGADRTARKRYWRRALAAAQASAQGKAVREIEAALADLDKEN